MKTIKIDIDSIKINENYQNKAVISGVTEYFFSGNLKDIPEDLKLINGYFIREIDSENNFSAILNSKEDFEIIKSLKLFKVEQTTTIINNYLVNPDNRKFIFSYENTPLLCENCNKLTGFNDLSFEINEEGYDIVKCPNCGKIDFFEPFVFQDIKEIQN